MQSPSSIILSGLINAAYGITPDEVSLMVGHRSAEDAVCARGIK
jgi:hypothetical protein